MENISERQAADILIPYGIHLDTDLYENIAIYIETMLLWNRKISLTTVTDPSEILKFHFGESFFASSAAGIRDGRLADVGSGAGFPGIPLAMASSSLEVVLIDSNAKKTTFMSEATRKVGLKNVKVVRSRMEESRLGAASLDFVSSRALGQFDKFLLWSRTVLSDRGRVALWLGEKDVEAISHKSDWDWKGPLLIPNSAQRYILVGKPRY
jgi:16S rRNA (guanine527-N7)-methyltransferase